MTEVVVYRALYDHAGSQQGDISLCREDVLEVPMNEDLVQRCGGNIRVSFTHSAWIQIIGIERA